MHYPIQRTLLAFPAGKNKVLDLFTPVRQGLRPLKDSIPNFYGPHPNFLGYQPFSSLAKELSGLLIRNMSGIYL